LANQVAHLLGKRGPARGPPLAQTPPVLAKALVLPGDDRARLYELQSAMPAWSQARQPDPEEAIGRGEAWSVDGLFVYSYLVLESQNPQVQNLT